MIILTHRGLEPTKNNFFSESSYEAFGDHLKRGFGIEFDVNFTKDGKIVIVHDSTLERITNGQDKRPLSEVSSSEINKIKLQRGRLCFFDELANLIQKGSSIVNALHLKGKFQDKKHLDILITALKKNKAILKKILVFDVKPQTARYLLKFLPNLKLAPSVAHPYDIKRYNAAVLQTLISVNRALKLRKIYSWVWLDEWDLTDKNNGKKTLYNQGTFEKLKATGYKIALVTPELHGTSPGLLGGETHSAAKDPKILFKRIREIILLKPSAICTDYPEEVKNL